VNNRLLCADQRLIGALNQVLARLSQHLNRDVVGNQILVNQRAHKIEIGLAG
jgi:hypothetical protein